MLATGWKARLCLRGTLSIVSLMTCSLLSAATAAGDDSEHHLAHFPSDSSRRDMQVTLQASSALRSDPELKGLRLNLYVRVHKGVATVEGPVPSAAIARRAVEVLEQVRGIREVRNGLIVTPGLRAPEAPIVPLPPTAATQTLSGASPQAEPMTHSTAPPAGPPPPPQTTYSSSPAAPQRWTGHGRAPAVPTTRRTGAPLSTAPSGPGIQLLPPAQMAAAPNIEPREANPGQSLREEIERIRKSEERFRFLQVEVQGDTLVVQGENGAAVMALARRLTHLPGIKHVIIQVRPGQD